MPVLVSAVFVDKLNMWQVHDTPLPVLNAGNVISIDAEGEVEYNTHKYLDLEGSYATKLLIRCDGRKVEVAGNPGRYCRPDNVFGFTYEGCVQAWNDVLAEFGLPPFEGGRFAVYHNDVGFTGAVNTAIDLTKNYELGDMLSLYMRYLATQQHSRLKVGVSADGMTVKWGEGSKYVYEIFYAKGVELRKRTKGDLEFVERLADWCDAVGIGRHEVKLKTRFLSQNLLRFMAITNSVKLNEVYMARTEKLFATTVQWDTLNDLPPKLRATAKDWRDGLDLAKSMNPRTYRRHRSELKAYGIDIAVQCTDVNTFIKPLEVKVVEAVAPEWYWANSAPVRQVA